MKQALGIQKRNGRWSVGGWRNRFICYVDSTEYHKCENMVIMGYMSKTKLDERIFGEDSWYYVATEKAKNDLKKQGYKIVEVN